MKFTLHPLATTEATPAGSGGGRGTPALPVDAGLCERLQRSFSRFEVHGDALARVFYERLFAAYPNLRGMFAADLAGQRKKLMDTLGWVVTHLSDRPAVLAEVAALGQRHVKYGARPEHYPLVVKELLAAMREVDGAGFDAEAEADWRGALELISERMIGGMSTEC